MIKYTILILAFILLFASESFSQDSTKMHLKLHKVIKEKIKDKLNLDDEVYAKFSDYYDNFQVDSKLLNKKRLLLLKNIEKNIDVIDNNNKIEELVSLEGKIHLIRKEFIENLKSIFTPNQLAKFIIFSQKVRKFLSKEISKKKQNN